MTEVRPEDEGYKATDGAPDWNQSYYFNFYDPARQVGGFFRIGILESQRSANSAVILFRNRRLAHYEWRSDLPYTDRRMSDGVTTGGQTYTSLEPLRRSRVQYERGDLSLDLVFEALHPLVNVVTLGTAVSGSIGSGHLEGAASVAGTVRLREETFEIRATGFRDVAWGRRNWQSMAEYRLAWPVFADGAVFANVHAELLGGGQHDVGFFHDGERTLALKQVESELVIGEDGLTPRACRWRFRDQSGRDREFHGSLVFGMPIPLGGFVLSENLFEYRLGGSLGYGVCERGVRLPIGS